MNLFDCIGGLCGIKPRDETRLDWQPRRDAYPYDADASQRYTRYTGTYDVFPEYTGGANYMGYMRYGFPLAINKTGGQKLASNPNASGFYDIGAFK